VPTISDAVLMMVGTPLDAFASGGFAHPTAAIDVGAPVPHVPEAG